MNKEIPELEQDDDLLEGYKAFGCLVIGVALLAVIISVILAIIKDFKP